MRRTIARTRKDRRFGTHRVTEQPSGEAMRPSVARTQDGKIARNGSKFVQRPMHHDRRMLVTIRRTHAFCKTEVEGDGTSGASLEDDHARQTHAT
mmetsp:Transcript_6945/g.24711  ORF Transcript_6945/g.24711 Transcript_6945/m.24711 type:complete len:95 (-) Transcript_6945:1269-1553(-)